MHSFYDEFESNDENIEYLFYKDYFKINFSKILLTPNTHTFLYLNRHQLKNYLKYNPHKLIYLYDKI